MATPLYAVLGTIEFQVLPGPTGLEPKWATDYAEQPRTEGKPVLQWIGDKLDEYGLKFRFHHAYCDPESEVKRLRQALSAHTALPFVLGNGDYKGMFVIVEIGGTVQHAAPDGTVRLIEVTVALREYPDAPRPVRPSKALVKAGAPVPPRALQLAAAAKAGSQTVAGLGTALAVLSAARRAASAVAAWRRGDVVGALGPLAGLADQALSTLGIQSQVLGGANVASLAQQGITLYNTAKNARNLLTGLTVANLPGRIGAMGTVLGDIDTHSRALSPIASQLAANLGARRTA